MAGNTYGTASSGNPTNVYCPPELLLAADCVMVWEKITKTIAVPKNKSEVLSLLRAVTPTPNTTEVAEGVTPAPRAITYENPTKTWEEFVEVFQVSSRQADLGERNVLMDSKDRLIDLMRRTRELNAWYEYREANNVIYNSSAIVSRATVNGTLTLGRLRKAAALIDYNRGKRQNSVSKGSLMQGTAPVEPAFFCVTHTDCKTDYRDMPGFRVAALVGGAKEVLPEWFGNIEDFMVIAYPEAEPRLAAGAAVGSTGMRSAGAVSVDVYTSLVFAKEALGKGNLKGEESSEGLGGTWFKVFNEATKDDPGNQRRLVSSHMWDCPIILNQNWTVAIEHGATSNPV